MSIRAVIFDYGMVLCQPDSLAYKNLLSITGLDAHTFETYYWRDRRDYDLGLFEGREYWAKFAAHAGVQFTPEQIDQLVDNDVRLWTGSITPSILAWVQSLQAAGLATAILSNMVPDVLRTMLREFAWLDGFTQLTWSCELHIVKPDRAIYLHTCERLGIPPAECLFLDDKPENVEGAEAAGLVAIQFTDGPQLARELARRNLLQDHPLPVSAESSSKSNDAQFAVPSTSE